MSQSICAFFFLLLNNTWCNLHFLKLLCGLTSMHTIYKITASEAGSCLLPFYTDIRLHRRSRVNAQPLDPNKQTGWRLCSFLTNRRAEHCLQHTRLFVVTSLTFKKQTKHILIEDFDFTATSSIILSNLYPTVLQLSGGDTGALEHIRQRIHIFFNYLFRESRVFSY